MKSCLALMPRWLVIAALASCLGTSEAAIPGQPSASDAGRLAQAVSQAANLPRLHSLIVLHDGSTVVQRVFHGPGLDAPVDVKSLSKVVIDTLVGIAIDRGVLKGTDQEALPLLGERAPARLDPRVGSITLDELLSMRAGLQRTSGPFYGQWVNSHNWVRFVLSRPFEEQPRGAMLYSTGNTHLLSAILTDASGRSTWQLSRQWLGRPLDIDIPAWTRDPQGIYFGGNEMALSPRALAKLGETYRQAGLYRGRRIVSDAWVRRSWAPATTDLWGHGYGYGWFISQVDGRPVYFGWGFGGQMLYVVPSLALTVVMTSDASQRSIEGDYICALHARLARKILPTFITGQPTGDESALCGTRQAIDRP